MVVERRFKLFVIATACTVLLTLSTASDVAKRKRRNRYSRAKESGVCELEIHCKEDYNSSGYVKLPIRGPRGPVGPPGERGPPGEYGLPGLPGLPGAKVSSNSQRIAFFVGLTNNIGPVDEHTEVVFDKVVTNMGGGYDPVSGKFTAPVNGTYQFNIVISAQGKQKAAVMLLKNGEMVATVWAESIPYWATSSNIAILSLEKGDRVWLLLLNRASYLHGYMYTTFSGFIIFEN